MSHQTPSTVSNHTGPADFLLTTDAGSLSISGTLFLSGTGPITTTAAGSTVLIQELASPAPTIFVTNSGTASADVNSILQFHSNTPFIVTSASGDTLELNVELVPVQIGGTGQTVLTTNSLLYGSGSSPIGQTSPAQDGEILLASTGGPPEFAIITSSANTLLFTRGPNQLNIEANVFGSSFFNPLTLGNGGTGRTALTLHAVLLGEGSFPINTTNVGTNGEVLIASSTGDPAFSRISSTGGTLSFIFGANSLNIDVILLNSSLFNPLSIANGGTGRTVLSAYGVLIGEGSLNINVTPPGSSGQLLIASSTGNPKFAYLTSSGGTITFVYGYNALNMDFLFPQTFAIPLSVPQGGTGRTVLTTYGVLLGEGTFQINVTAAGTDGQTLIASSAGDPQFASISSSGNSVFFTPGPNALNLEVNSTNITFTAIVPVASGGSGKTIFTAYSVLLGEGSLGILATPAGTDGQLLIGSSTGAPLFASVTSTGGTISFTSEPNLLNMEADLANSSFFNPLLLNFGGTGRTIFTSFAVLLGEGSLPINTTNVGTNGQVLISSSSGDPKFVTITSSGGTVTFTFGYNALNIDVINTYNFIINADSGSASPQNNTFSLLGSSGLTTSGAGSTITLQIDSNNYTFFDPIPVSNGGTGLTFLTQFGVLIGEGSNEVHVTSPGTDGQLLIASSTGDPAFSTVTSTGGTLSFTVGNNFLNIDVDFSSGSLFNPLIRSNGGSGRTFLTEFGVLIGEGSRPINLTAPGANGQALIASSTGDPAFAAISSTGSSFSFTSGSNALNIEANFSTISFLSPITVGHGGTGNSLLTSFGVLFGEGSLPIGATSAGTDGQLLIASSTAAFAFMSVTSNGASILFTSGNNSLNMELNLSGALFLNPLPLANGGTGLTLLTLYGVLLGEGSNNVQVTNPGTDGQLLLASTTGDPAFSTLTSTGNTLVFTAGNNALNLDINLTNPLFNPLPVANGGTDDTSVTPYAVLCGGTNGTAPLQSIGFVGNPGDILVSSGPNSLPNFQPISSVPGFTTIVTRTFTSSSTYFPTVGMLYCVIECIGGGGGGGGAANNLITYGLATGGGGGGGGYVKYIATAATIGVSQTVIIGTGGIAGDDNGGNGAAGGSTSVGILVVANGGLGGQGSTGVSVSQASMGGAGGLSSGGNINSSGQPGGWGYAVADSDPATDGFAWAQLLSGAGGSSFYGAGGGSVGTGSTSISATSAFAGNDGTLYGGGGSGAYLFYLTSTGFVGGNGADGIVVITEFI